MSEKTCKRKTCQKFSCEPFEWCPITLQPFLDKAPFKLTGSLETETQNHLAAVWKCHIDEPWPLQKDQALDQLALKVSNDMCHCFH